MTQQDFDNQKWYKAMPVLVKGSDNSKYVAFVDFEKRLIGVSNSNMLIPFTIFPFTDVFTTYNQFNRYLDTENLQNKEQ